MSTISMTNNDENNCDCLGFKFNFSQNSNPENDDKRYQRVENTEVDELLVQGMNNLSFNARQREQDDLHGVSTDFVERKIEMDHALGLLQTKLNQIKHGTAYELAEAFNLCYVSNRRFRMNFLRANRYNAEAAAKQMIRHFDLKRRLFGRDKLTKDIAISDLSDDDIKSLVAGSYHVSKVRDRAGRLLLLKFPGLRGYKSLENELRGRFFFYTAMVKSLDSANSGVIMVNYNIDQFRDKSNNDGILENMNLTAAMPIFLSGIHLCFDRQSDILVAKTGLSLVTSEIAARVKIHYGSHLECQYSLNTFGIPTSVLPLNTTETDSVVECQMSWYRECLQKQTVPCDDRGKPKPNENDVLCLGKKVNNRGNEKLLQMASLHQDWYNAGDAKQRKIVVELMMESIRKNGGRFLKPDEGGVDLKELPADEIREKISQMFRNLKKKSRGDAQKSSCKKQLEVIRVVKTIHNNDVLFGRKCDHPGNEKLRITVDAMSGEYNGASRGRKKEIADFVVSEIKRNKGRFLKLADNGKWCEVSDKVAEKKVSAHFRNNRRGSKK